MPVKYNSLLLDFGIYFIRTSNRSTRVCHYLLFEPHHKIAAATVSRKIQLLKITACQFTYCVNSKMSCRVLFSGVIFRHRRCSDLSMIWQCLASVFSFGRFWHLCCVSFLRPAKQCPLGLQYRECISCCPASCNLERTCIDSKLACLDGCYCPEGEFPFRFYYLLQSLFPQTDFLQIHLLLQFLFCLLTLK